MSDGGDNIMRIAMLFMVGLLGDDEKESAGSVAVWIHNLCCVCIIAQLIILYTTSGLAKANGARWFNGTALFTISQVEWFSHPAFRSLLRNAFVVTVASYATVLYQVWCPMAIFSPFRIVWLGIGAFMHIGIGLTMGLWTFSVAMISLEMFLVRDHEYRSAFEWLKGRGHLRKETPPQYILLIDGYCARCRDIGAMIRRLDCSERVQVQSFRDAGHLQKFGLEVAAVEARMHIIDRRTSAIHQGFDAFYVVARSLFLAWPIVPILAIAKLTGHGPRLYDCFARARRIIPVSGACGDGGCSARNDLEVRQ
jgi:predicted DCC family thiol-disulfide oxidoreductase YuxK